MADDAGPQKNGLDIFLRALSVVLIVAGLTMIAIGDINQLRRIERLEAACHE